VSTLFFASLLILVAGLIGAISNLMAISKGKLEMKDGRFIHSILVGVVAIGSLGSLVSGALWIAQYLKG
jgi:hypothetical protein